MDTNNWRPPQVDNGMDPNSNWRNDLSQESRQKIVNKIMDTLQRHMPPTSSDGMSELKKIALRFEEKIYSAATNQQDYLRKISLKMLSLETKAHSPAPNSLPPNIPPGGSQKNLDPATGIMQPPQIRNPTQPLANGLQITAQAHSRQQLLSQNLQNSIQGGAMQSSTGLASALSSITGLPQATVSNPGGQSSGLQLMTGISQSTLNNSPGQVLSQNSIIANAQRQLQSRQQQHQQQVVQQQHQQQSQAQQQLLYQQQLQHQQQQAYLKQKQLQQQQQLQQQSHLQQQQQLQQQSHLQQQQSVLQQSQLQPSPQSVLQSGPQPVLQAAQQSILQQAPNSVLQSSQQSALQHTQPTSVQQTHQSVLPQHPQSVLRQQQSQQSIIQQQPSILQQQQSSMVQQSIIQSQPQLLGQQNNVSNMQQQQHQLQQLFQSKPAQHQQTQQQSSSLLQTQAQQSQQQSQQQQLLSQLQSQPTQLQQQQSLMQQPNSIQQELQRLQPSSGLLQQQQQQTPMEQQKQLLQHIVMSEASSTSMESSGQTGQPTVVDWQEKVYQRLQTLKDMYLQEIKELFTRLSLKCEQPMAADQTEKLKQYKTTLQRMMQYFHVQKSSIPQGLKEDKVDAFERQIITILSSFKQRKPGPPQQGQQQLQAQTGNQVSSMQQQPPSQISQMQQQEKHANQLQQMNLQASATTMQSANVTSMQHGSMPLLQQTSVQTSQQNIRSMMQPGANLNPTQGTGVGSLQQSSVNSLQQNNNVNPLQQNSLSIQQNINSVQQSGINVLQQNNINTLQSNVNALQQQQQQQQALKQQELQAQQYKHPLHQRQFHHQLLQQQQQQQHLQQQQLQHFQQQQQQLHQHKQQQAQLHPQLHSQQIPQLQISDLNNESKAKQAAAAKQAFMQQPHPLSQRSAYQQQQQQQLKPGSSLSVSSPQIFTAASPQVSQQSSPQIDQQNLVASSLQAPKAGTPLQSAASPFVTPSPSTLPAPSPLTEDAEKQSSAISSISNAGSGQGLQQPAATLSHPQSLAIGTPGISASPLLADFSPSPAQNLVSQDGHQTVSPGLLMADKSSTAEPPLERLTKILNAMSPKALDSAVSDLGSVVSLIDRMAGSAPGNGSRAAVGEDLVAMTKCRLQARNLMSQDGNAATKKMRRRMSSMPLSAVSSGGSVTNSLQQHNNLESPDMESTATSKIKRPRFESHAVQDEIREINQQLIDTVVEVSEDDNDAAAAAAEGRDGIVVKFSYNAIALSPNMKSRYKSTQMLPISPLRLLIPVDYPNCSPVLLDKVPVEPWEHDDLSSKAKAKFSVCVRNLQQPMSLKAMAKTWEGSARSVVAEYAHQSGGGSFSSRFGTWENCASA